MENWILHENIDFKQREILLITLISAQIAINGSVNMKVYFTQYPYLCLNYGTVYRCNKDYTDGEIVSYEELMNRLKKEIESL